MPAKDYKYVSLYSLVCCSTSSLCVRSRPWEVMRSVFLYLYLWWESRWMKCFSVFVSMMRKTLSEVFFCICFYDEKDVEWSIFLYLFLWWDWSEVFSFYDEKDVEWSVFLYFFLWWERRWVKYFVSMMRKALSEVFFCICFYDETERHWVKCLLYLYLWWERRSVKCFTVLLCN